MISKQKKKLKIYQRTTLSCFLVFLVTLTLGIIFLVVQVANHHIFSIIAFVIAALAVSLTILFEYLYRSARKYQAIAEGEDPSLVNAKPLKDQQIKKEKVLKENQPGSFMKNVRRVLRID